MYDFEEIINQYIKRLEEIKKHIEFISLQKDLYNEIKEKSNMELYSAKLGEIINSTVQYNSIIICLYGCFEEFIDSIATEYISIINELCTSYKDLPKSLRNKHMIKVGDFLSNPQRYKGYELTVEECIKNIYMSIYSEEERTLNTELLISHGGNLKVDKVYDLFRDLGIKDLKTELETKINKVRLKVLDDLIDQRNVISHSWEVDQRFAFIKIKDDIISLLVELGKTLKEILLDKIFLFIEFKEGFECFEKPIKVINNRILCINSKNSHLRIGDSILICKGNGKKIRVEVLELSVNRVNKSKIDEENIEIGIKVNKNIKANWTYYYVRK
ncbi:MAE_28990/MAE_18760 family HEPN-like nuclease [Veillonella sp.]|jgi:hypothetical protein|uniref:MAE_28990/MAE_18760 family HEPN-like nuclease n=1 Tax=Veillonella sp. TaxID=1926307 RepID=UPI0028FDECBD|nr:MAE_28990/MAE_18760 family HEPN-like nuclease [Veillonella sp.]MDU2301624.1 MAE_28990/MAE_18760 family HEPN-like nuclease [Veillonella sp.]MDU2388497.1 MAE_28990/MAE_18760 family HEPN-like nuclease [Veillonella sp.]